MATISHIPNPISIAVKTAGYTIPENRYARAIVNVTGSATFNINGVTALAGTQNNVLSSSSLTVQLKTYSALSGSYPINVNAYGLLTNEAGSTIMSTPAPSAAFAATADQKNLVQDYYLPAGTVINGTGVWRAVVEEYGG